MKVKKEIVVGTFVVVIFVAGIALIYNYGINNDRNKLARRIAELGNPGGPPETVEGLREAIRLYEKQIEQHVKDAAQVGVYWRILAVRLQNRGLHNEALGALEQAVFYSPQDASLLYLTGISAARVAKSFLDFSGGAGSGAERYYALAEDAYRRAIALDERYAKPMYALGVLYVFELGRPEDAIPVMERYLTLTANDVDGMAVLAHAYALTSRYEFALDLYDKILSITKDKTKRAAVEESRRQVMDSYYG
ncbi:MAG: tetratricopeptide repeat protein [Spirochaetaceae bacterium]|jgi:tetratricopeptide (TPR) repeat protein|nr:tetratricopeptide repeat protein [Spirochaetaceae bacterium]